MDAHVQRLQRFFREHPVWVDAAQSVKEGAESLVQFSHVNGQWHLERTHGESLLLEGPPRDPDFAFRFTPRAIERITSADGGLGDFAVELLACIVSDDEADHVEFRVVSPFAKLLKRGYVQVLLRGGPKVLQFGAARGVRTLSDLRRVFKDAQSGAPLSPADTPS